MSVDEDEGTTMLVTLRILIAYRGEARRFNPDDVAFLAKEGIESHYDVLSCQAEAGATEAAPE